MRAVAALLLVGIVTASSARASSFSEARPVLAAAARAMGHFGAQGTIEARGEVDAEGRTGRYTELVRARDGAFVNRHAYSQFSDVEGYDGKRRWKQDRSGATHVLNAPFTVAGSVTSAWFKRRGYLQAGSARVERVEHDTINGAPATILTMRPAGGNPIRLTFDDHGHLLVRAQWDRPLDTITETYSDYRSVDGFKVPFHIEDEESGDRVVARIERYFRSAQSGNAPFTPPPPPRDTVIAASATIPLSSPNYALIPARINGHDYQFILDTGGHDIVSPAIAAELGLKSEGEGTSGGSGPGRETTSDTRIAELKLGSATMTNQHFTVLDFGEKPPLAGILGLEIFERMMVTIDEPHGRLTIEPFRPGRRCEGDKIPLFFDDDQPSVYGTVDGIPAFIGVDTGNGGIPIVLWRWAEAHKVADRYRNGKEQIGHGVGGANTSYRTAHHEIVIGRTALHDMDVHYATTPTGYFSSRADSMNLGRALLQKYVVRFDYANGNMCVMKPRD